MVFSITDFGEQPAQGFTPKQAIVNENPAIVLDAVSDAFSAIGKGAKAKAEAASAGVISEYTRESLKIAEAVNQGSLKSTEAKQRMRVLFSKYSAAAPGMTEDLLKTHKSIVTTSGLGKIIEEGTEQEQAYVKLEQAAVANGWVNATDNQSAREVATQKYANHKRSLDELAAIQAEVTLSRGRVGLKADELQLEQAQLKARSQKALASVSSTYSPKFKQDMASLVARYERGEIGSEEAVREAQLAWNSVQTVVSQVGAMSGSDHITSLSRPMQDMYSNTVEFLNGKLSKQILDTQNEKALALAQQEWLSNPKLAAVAALDRLLPNTGVVQVFSHLNGDVIKTLDKMGKEEGIPANLISSDAEEKQAVGTYLNVLDANMNKANTEGLDDATSKQLNTNLSNVLKSVNAYGLASSNPKDYQQVVDFLASPTFGKYQSKLGGIPAEVASQAKTILQQQYEQQVIPLIRQEYETGVIGSGGKAVLPGNVVVSMSKPVPISESIKPEFTGAGIAFRVTNINKSGAADARLKAAELNKRVAPVLNKLIRMGAHLDGTTDYKKVFEENYAAIFGMQPEVKPKAAETKAKEPATAKPRTLPSVGESVNGWVYLGGDPKDKSSWRKQGD